MKNKVDMVTYSNEGHMGDNFQKSFNSIFSALCVCVTGLNCFFIWWAFKLNIYENQCLASVGGVIILYISVFLSAFVQFMKGENYKIVLKKITPYFNKNNVFKIFKAFIITLFIDMVFIFLVQINFLQENLIAWFWVIITIISVIFSYYKKNKNT